jgi:hypothetical protein
MSDYAKKPTNSGRKCQFCGDPEHFGMCAELVEAQRVATSKLKPVPNPIVRN